MQQEALPLNGGLETGVLYREDNLTQLAELPDACIDLIYLDPPFFSNRVYEVIWGDEAEVRSFRDRWEGGMQHYIGWMRERVAQMHRVLKPTGSLYLHCDPHASHYLKVMLDGIFRAEHFLNEIAWKRTSAHSSANRYGPVHDVILFYAKSSSYTWNPTYSPYDEFYLSQFYVHVDPDGRRWRRSDLTGAGTRRGTTGDPWRGIDVTAKGRHWAWPPSVLDEMDAKGRIHWPEKKGGVPMLKRYADEQRGVPLQDVWTDLRPLHNMSRERLGYPTQKPESLLERILTASSNKGDVVLDPFCGCGTTVAVAARLDRNWIGIDISTTAMEIMKWRLHRQGVTATIAKAPESIEALKELAHFEFQNWVINAILGTHSPRLVGDMGIDGFAFLTKEPVQVKQSERVGRNVIDNFETAIRRAGHSSGFVIAFSFTKGAYEEVARVKSEGLEIKLVKVAEILLSRSQSRSLPQLLPQAGDVLNFMPQLRKAKDLPSPEELIASDRQAVG